MGKTAPVKGKSSTSASSTSGKSSTSASSRGKASMGKASPMGKASSMGKASPSASWGDDEWGAMQAHLDSKAGMHSFTRLFKPALYNAGATPSLGEGSARVRAERVKLAVQVLKAHDLFDLRAILDVAMKDEAFKKRFGMRLKTVLCTADKVAFYSAEF